MSVRSRLTAIGLLTLPLLLGATAPLAHPATVAAPALDNGLAKTPQMGFNNWNATHCRAEFNESMVKGIADLFVNKGLKAAGYQYVNLDDCWALPQRDSAGNLVPDPVRFPNGIKAVADYVHSKGLKFGLYSSAGSKTCDTNGFPGGLGHEKADAKLWASWGVDYLKYDNCNNEGVDAKQRYTAMHDALAATGRPILYSLCEWGENKPWTWAKDVGNSWRTTGDISDNWGSMLSIFKQNVGLAPYAGPGHWNDPDMLEVGNGGMTDTEYRSHFSLWSIMAAPLLIGSDIRKATPATMEILTNKEVIAVDQDRLGAQGQEISNASGLHVISKPLSGGDRAVALFNETAAPATISTTAAKVGLPQAGGYTVRDLWTHTTRETAGTIGAVVPPHGTVLLRVGNDRNWPQYPPAVRTGIEFPVAYPGAPVLAEPGKAAKLSTVAVNDGAANATNARVQLTAPQGWTVQPQSATSTPKLAPGKELRTQWALTPPAGTKPGTYSLAVRTSYQPQSSTSDYQLAVAVVAPQPGGTSGLGDDQWISADNGWGPVERNTSNGEQGAGDGHPMKIGGVSYAKGLGVHAPSTVEYYLGGRCTSVRSTVGLDDEANGNGSVSFEVWADGRKVADSGVLRAGSGGKALTADLTGASLLRLVVTDGGDGNTYDHADWAGAELTCS
ncbi:NPCBM/NEW2 domain-containing protein [Kutzneria albida]|uniref:Alpha-galactosidase n=1 Tax=Kutzneria albida DSM 43870 TaxID=1449976 RepID=W5W4R0_9PSEU|nr:NPCBM/NEW2 domain-containing protein [Kutzneria albida]AHH96213.1 alpha-galactosidase [Kutzneria albida DSM 43870]